MVLIIYKMMSLFLMIWRFLEILLWEIDQQGRSPYVNIMHM
jgi:hypothetical protein